MDKELLKAMFYLEANRYDEAKKAFREILQKRPNARFVQYMILVCMLNTDTPTIELEKFAKLILSRNAQHSIAHFAMGKVHEARFEYDKAVSHFKTALSIEPENIDYLCGLALVFWITKKHEEAWHLINRSLSLDPQNIKALTYKSHFDRLHLDLNAANISLDKALSYDPMNWVLFAQKGKVALLNMDYNNAEKNFKQSIRLNPHNPDLKDEYINCLLARNPVFRVMYSKYWIFNEAHFAVRPILVLILVMMITFYKMKHPAVSSVRTLLIPIMVISIVANYFFWIIAPIYRLLKSRQLWKAYYRKFWSHEIFVQTNMQLALLAISYYYFTNDFRGASSAFILTWYSIFAGFIFLNESPKIQRLNIIILATIYVCATINLTLDILNISITPIELVVVLGWLFILLLDEFIKWFRN